MSGLSEEPGRRRSTSVEDLVLDLRFALRGLGRNRIFTAVAAATIAVGVGATAIMLAIGHAVLLRPPPVAEPDRMVSVWELRSGSVSESIEGRLLPYPRYEAYREGAGDVFEDLAGHAYTGFSVATDQGAVAVDGFVTSGNYFAVLGVEPLVGRLYESDDDPSVVLSERLWRSRFGADPSVLGRTVAVESRPFTVVGVVAGGFTGTMSGFSGDMWVPAVAFDRSRGGDGRDVAVVPIGRLRSGVGREAAQERIDALARSIPPEADRVEVRGARLDGLLWRADLKRIFDLGMAVMLGTAALLLLIACANVAGMMVARSFDRRREISVRLAIGAGPGRLVRQMLVESVLLALIGGAAGVLVAVAGTAALSRISLPVGATVTLDLVPDPVVLLVSFVVAAGAGILFGLGPALRSAATDLTTALKEGAQGPSPTRTRTVFVVGQVALSTLLLVVAGLLVRSLTSVADVPLGFDPQGVLTADLSVASHGYSEEEGRMFYRRLLDRVRALPGVEAAGLGRFVLLGGSNASHEATAVGGSGDIPSISLGFNVVDPEYFRTSGIELVEGRVFTDADDPDGAPVAVLNRSAAARLWPDDSPLGRRFRAGGVEREVVGIVRDGVYRFQAESPQAFAFYPYAQQFQYTVSLHVRAAAPPGPLVTEIRGIVRELDPNIALASARRMEEVIAANRFGHTFLARFTMVVAGIGLLLSAIGVYGLLAVQVAQRGKEFGVRRALGAGMPHVLVLVLRRGVVAAVIGCVLGLVAALAAGRLLASLLFQVSPFDPLTFLLVPVVLVGTALAAGALPARHAARIAPTEALRQE